MSLSKQTETTQSPVARYYSWSGTEGKFTWYNKETGTKEIVDGSITFIPIDQLSCVEGYSSKHENGFRSNEVKATTTEELIVRWNRGSEIIRGLYKEIKPEIEKIGGKYHRSIYAIEVIDGQVEIVNLRLKGAAMSAWLNFDKSTSMNLEGLTIKTGCSDLKKTGMVKYYEPTFTASPTSEKAHTAAVEADVKLQEYFDSRSNWDQSSVESELTEEEASQLKKPRKEKIISKTEIEESDADDFFSEGFE